MFFLIDILACNCAYKDVFVMMNCLVFCLMTVSVAKVVELKTEFEYFNVRGGTKFQPGGSHILDTINLGILLR